MDIRTFLAHAVKLEAAAAQGSDSLADAMETWGNREVEAFFRQMAEFSRLHLKEAMDRAGFRHVSELPAEGYLWPDGIPPESTQWFGIDGLMNLDHAVALALEAERRGLAFYEHIAGTEVDPRVRMMAAEFAAEERGHVAQLERLACDPLNCD
ncbi:MAG: ferritin-like protein [Proteobacteria bacterium]|jgi:rubrerythrin|nr:ferritin-like protein [Pseudomonadota bacterium]